jgi:large subunit ribosomal protein L9
VKRESLTHHVLQADIYFAETSSACKICLAPRTAAFCMSDYRRRRTVQIQVLLTQEVEKLGKAGEVKRVARGFARNFLLPRGLVVIPTPGAIRQVEMNAKAAAKRNVKLTNDAQVLAAQLEKLTLTFTAKVGEQGRLYGSITTQDIADKLQEKLGVEIDRRKIELSEPLRLVGDHTVNIRLHSDVSAKVSIQIKAEEEPAASNQ